MEGDVWTDSNVDGYNESRYICIVTPLSPTNPNNLLPLPVAMFHILVAVADQDRHGYAIMQDVAARTNGALKLEPRHAVWVDPTNARRGAHRRAQ